MSLGEVVISTAEGDEQSLLWDLRSTAILGSYKGNPKCGRHGLATVGDRLLLGSQADKGALRVWAWEKDQPLHKFSGPEKIPVVAVTPDGIFCAAGSVSGKIYIWEITTGQLLRTVDAHFKAVTALKFVDDGSLLVSGGGDAGVHVWTLASLVDRSNDTVPVPRYSWSDHSLAVTDIHCGMGGAMARVATVSLDRTCKIWELISGQLLASIAFPTFLQAVIMDPSEFRCFVGGGEGSIFQLSMYSQKMVDRKAEGQREIQASAEEGFKGHSHTVTCLSLSYDATFLVSGGQDGAVIVWDIAYRQMLKAFRQHTGPITNILITTKPPGLVTQPGMPATSVLFSPFNRYAATDSVLASYSVKMALPSDMTTRGADMEVRDQQSLQGVLAVSQ
eukprot:Ihof_evm2s582 gene=Ihof_evmTU2s582